MYIARVAPPQLWLINVRSTAPFSEVSVCLLPARRCLDLFPFQAKSRVFRSYFQVPSPPAFLPSLFCRFAPILSICRVLRMFTFFVVLGIVILPFYFLFTASQRCVSRVEFPSSSVTPSYSQGSGFERLRAASRCCVLLIKAKEKFLFNYFQMRFAHTVIVDGAHAVGPHMQLNLSEVSSPDNFDN